MTRFSVTRLGLSVIALTFFANSALAADDCIVPEVAAVPEVIAEPNAEPPILGSPAIPAIPARPCDLNLEFGTTALNSAIDAEKAAREAADTTETTERKAADATEKAAREAADETEKAAREAADAAEAATREAADTALGARITNEAAASRARDDALSDRIDENSEAIEDAIALSAAIPDSWLSDSENFAIAVGGGFTDGSSAIGAIGTFRINKNLSAYGGGSALADGGTWAAKGGIRLGW
jgi:hypothetical protein